NIFNVYEKQRHVNRIGLALPAIEEMLQERVEARKNRDYQKADRIRDILSEKGIILQDKPKGTEWRVKNIPSK
ncbi:MAG: hypothetical protein NTU90_08710, partial [Proteobacteria bacterium]|nr:hypothetical protein [Pseudomonadota bacterium]